MTHDIIRSVALQVKAYHGTITIAEKKELAEYTRLVLAKNNAMLEERNTRLGTTE